MDKDFYNVLDNMYGKQKDHTSYHVIEIQNAGWSDPKRPSWFTSTNGRDPMRFTTVKEAKRTAKELKKKLDFRHRVVIRTVTEMYIEV